MEKKDIIFCQGNKRELEEITGEQYEYLMPKKVLSWKDGTVSQTFLQTPELASGAHREIDARSLERQMYDLAREVGADGVIHYRVEAYLFRPGISKAYAQGTPVRKKTV